MSTENRRAKTVFASNQVNLLVLRVPKLVIHHEADVHAPRTRNDSFWLVHRDSDWQQEVKLKNCSTIDSHWVEIEFKQMPRSGQFDLFQDPNEKGLGPFLLMENHSYEELMDSSTLQNNESEKAG